MLSWIYVHIPGEFYREVEGGFSGVAVGDQISIRWLGEVTKSEL